MAKTSPHWRADYSSVQPSPISEERIKLLEDYVKWDDGPDGRELCWIVHVEGEVCRRLEGHDD